MGFQNCNYVSWNCVKLFVTFWMFLDCFVCFLELKWMFPGVVLDVSWSCTGHFLGLYYIFLELYWMSDELKRIWTGVKMDWIFAGYEYSCTGVKLD